MFGINNLKKKIQFLSNRVSKLEYELYIIENPIRFKNGDTIWYYNEECHDKPIKCKCMGLKQDANQDRIYRIYYIMEDRESFIQEVKDYYLSNNKNCL